MPIQIIGTVLPRYAVNLDLNSFQNIIFENFIIFFKGPKILHGLTSCTLSYQCQDYTGLTCQTPTCLCPANYYWDTTQYACGIYFEI